MPNSWQCRALALLGALTIIFLLWPICCCAAKPTRSPLLNTNSIPIQYSPLTTSTTTTLTDISTKINNSKEQKLIQIESSITTDDMLKHNSAISYRSSHKEQQQNMGYDKINVISDTTNGTKFDLNDTLNRNNYSRALNTVFNKLKLHLNHNDDNVDDINDINDMNDEKQQNNDVKSSRLTLIQDITIVTPSNTFLKSTTVAIPATTSVYEIFNITSSPSKLGVLQRADRSVKNINNTTPKRNKTNSNKTKISHLDRNERSANLSHITGGARKIQLYIKNRFLQLLPDGTINGTTDDLSDFTILQRTTVNVGQIKIQGVATCLFLCMDTCGTAYGSNVFSDDCIFNESMEQHHYNTYSSFHSNNKRKLYLALNRHGQPRKIQLPSTRQLGKLATYTKSLTQTVEQDRVDDLISRLYGGNHVRHGLKQLCDTGRALQQLLTSAMKPKPKCNTTKPNKSKKKKKRKCRDDEQESENCMKSVPNSLGVTSINVNNNNNNDEDINNRNNKKNNNNNNNKNNKDDNNKNNKDDNNKKNNNNSNHNNNNNNNKKKIPAQSQQQQQQQKSCNEDCSTPKQTKKKQPKKNNNVKTNNNNNNNSNNNNNNKKQNKKKINKPVTKTTTSTTPRTEDDEVDPELDNDEGFVSSIEDDEWDEMNLSGVGHSVNFVNEDNYDFES
ncbi:unnamed protein product [Diamesa serratosioi]